MGPGSLNSQIEVPIDTVMVLKKTTNASLSKTLSILSELRSSQITGLGIEGLSEESKTVNKVKSVVESKEHFGPNLIASGLTVSEPSSLVKSV